MNLIKGMKIIVGTMLLLPILFPLIFVIIMFDTNPQKENKRNRLINAFIDKIILFYEKLSKFVNKYIYN